MDFKYQIIENFIEDDFIDFIQDYYSMKINSKSYTIEENKFTYGYSFYGNPLMETILQNSCESLSSIVGENLLPTYSYVNFHMNGDAYNHKRNNSSEVSALLCLGSSDDSNLGPVNFTKGKMIQEEIHLKKGDLFLYNNLNSSCERNPLETDWLLEANLNFVLFGGDNEEFIYDKRQYLGFPK